MLLLRMFTILFFFLKQREVLGQEDLELDDKLKRLCNWLRVPVYVYCGVEDTVCGNGSQRCVWTKYEPNINLSPKANNCRFYITLFYNRIQRSFDRITPLRGCNCQIPPPLSLLQNSYGKYTLKPRNLFLC